jgi:uncharacterized Zn finger protein (UPF0148 family)
MPMMDEIACPACGSPKHYRLKDERLQCAECRKKYSEATNRCRLSKETMQHMVRSFWRRDAASASACRLEVNLKTLQKYHHVLRRAISDAGDEYACRQFGGCKVDPVLFRAAAEARGIGGAAQPIFCVVLERDKLRLLSAEDAEGDFADLQTVTSIGWIYARNREARVSLDLDRIHFLAVDTASGNSEPAGFWLQAKRGLVKYHGGFRKNFQLFMREMEFRFNNEDEETTCGILLDLLQKTATNPIRR